MSGFSDAIRQAREKWHYRGQVRPPFAEATAAGQESVWDYPRPPRIESDSRSVVVAWQGQTIAETNRALRVLETASPPTFYLPPEDVRTDLLRSAPGGSICEWKGQARYWSVVLGDDQIDHAAWSYDQPFENCREIAGCFSFYPGKLDCYVDGVRATPQPGGLYGGWITPDVVGPFKGAPGTGHW